MGNRLSKIYTRTGDDGTTGLGSGDRISKDDPRVEAYGTVDELNSAIGVLACHDLPGDVAALLADIQQHLFDLGGELSMPDTIIMTKDAVDSLEKALDGMNESLPALKEFVLPGGSPEAADCHMARAICRRAERRTITLAAETAVNEESVRYLNRLSDLLFVLARFLNKASGANEVLWSGSRNSND